MEAAVDEIAPDVFRISVYVSDFDLTFNHFVVRDEQPLLFTTGMRRMFPLIRAAADRVIDTRQLRWIGYSHFEVDECGALNEWLAASPHAEVVHGFVGVNVNLVDFADRPPRTLMEGQTLETGRRRFRFVHTPHLPHGWDAGVLYEETSGTMLVSDLFHQIGRGPAVTDRDLLGRVREALTTYQAGPLMNYLPYHTRTAGLFEKLASYNPRTLAVMHGTSYTGDGAAALRGLHSVMREVLGSPA